MDSLKQKVKATLLFTPQEKIDILVSFDTITTDDKTKLETIIDEYDAKYAKAIRTMKAGVTEELTGIVNDANQGDKDRITASAEKIKSGLASVIPSA